MSISKTPSLTTRIIDDLKIIQQILNDEKRALSKKQRAIMINTRLNSFENLFNELNVAKGKTSEEKSNELEKILEYLNDELLNYTEYKTLVEENTWYNLCLIRNKIITRLLELWGKGGVLSLSGTANALANILMGIEVLDVDEYLVSPEHPGYIKRYSTIYSYLSSIHGLYLGVIFNLHTVSKEEFCEWGKIGLESLRKQREIIEDQFPLQARYQRYQKRGLPTKKFHQNFFKDILLYTKSCNIVIRLTSVFGRNWPKQLEPTEQEVNEFEDVLEILEKWKKKYRQLYEEYLNHLNNGNFDINDEPMKLSIAQIANINMKVTTLKIRGLKILHQYFIVGEEEPAIKSLTNLVEEIFNFLEEKASDLTNPELLELPQIDQLSKELPYLISFVGLLALKTEKFSLLTRLERNLGILLTRSNQKRNPDFYAFYLSMRLTYFAQTLNIEKIDYHAEEMIRQTQYFKIQPRDAFAYTLMGHLALIAIEKEVPTRGVDIVEGKFEEIKGYINEKLVAEIEEYLFILNKILSEGETAAYPLNRINETNPFDIKTLFVPDLKRLNSNKIIYLPFNLASDRIKG